MGRKEITQPTIKRLYALSGNICAFPNCNQKLVSTSAEEIISQICHIEAAEIGGQRYNPGQTDEERRAFENLILLCANHHIVTNDIETYTVEVLKTMKRDHELKIELATNRLNELGRNPSILGSVINAITKAKFIGKPAKITPKKAFIISNKIAYNGLSRYKPIIDKYKIYQGKLSKIYREFEKDGNNKEDVLLDRINWLYLEAKERLGLKLESSNNFGDLIIDEVKIKLMKIIEDSSNIEGIEIETIDIGVITIIVDAFMKCKILEEPPKDFNSN